MARFDIAVEVALDADPAVKAGAYAWTDATQYVRRSSTEAVAIGRGRTNNSSTAPPQTLAIVVDNRDGRWTARNPLGAWYGQIRRNIPIRVLVGDELPIATDTFTRTVVDGWSSADLGDAYTLSGAGGTVSDANFDVTGTAATVAVPVASAFRIAYLTAVDEVDQTAYLEMTVPAPTGGNLEPGCLMLRGQTSSEYYNCRVHITTGLAVKVQIDHAGSTTLVAETTVVGLTHAAATPLKVRAQAYGSTVRMRVWQGSTEPTTWHASAVDSDPIEVAGYVGIRTGRATGNTNAGVTATYDNYAVTMPAAEFEGYIVQIPKRWDRSLKDCVAPLTAAGYLRRLAKSDRPLRSALYRTLTSADYTAPVAYWPMEDGSGAGAFGSALGGSPIGYSDMTPAAYSGCVGSGSLPTLGAAALATGNVPVPPLFSFPGTRWSIRFVVNVPATPASDVYPLGWYTSGSLTWRVVITALNTIRVEAFDSSFTEVLGAALPTVLMGRAIMVGVDAVQNGANIDWTITHYPGAVSSGTVAGQSVGRPTTVRIGDSPGLVGGSVGHIAVYVGSVAPSANAAVDGWAGTTVYSRINGLCHDANIPILITDGTPTTMMGPQPQSGLLALLQDAEHTDLGILSEAGFGLRYLSRWERYNRDVDIALDFNDGHIDGFEPIDDDLETVNDIEVSRPAGSSYRYINPTHMALYDRDDAAETLNVYADSDLPYQAQERVWLGTVDEDRLPAVDLNFARSPALVDAWRQRVVGSRMTIDNPPEEFGTDQLDVHIEGWQQVITPSTWTARAFTSPAWPWQVWSVTSGGMADTTGSTTGAALGTATARVNVTTPSGPLWNTALTHDIGIEGEHLRASVANATADTFARSVSNGWGSEPSSAVAWTTSGGAASDYAVTGGVGQQGNATVNVLRTSTLDIGSADVDYTVDVSLVPANAAGAPITQWVCARLTDLNNYYIARLDLSTGGNVSLGLHKRVAAALTNIVAQTTVGTGHAANEIWRVRFQCIGTLLRAKAWIPASATEPADWQVSITDTALTTGTLIGLLSRTETGNSNTTPVIASWDNVSVTNPQGFTLTRSVNGVVKTHPSGAAVSLWRPTVPAL